MLFLKLRHLIKLKYFICISIENALNVFVNIDVLYLIYHDKLKFSKAKSCSQSKATRNAVSSSTVLWKYLSDL